MNYDLAIIGAGPGGTDAAEHAAAHGLKVILFEKNKLAAAAVVCKGLAFMRVHFSVSRKLRLLQFFIKTDITSSHEHFVQFFSYFYLKT